MKFSERYDYNLVSKDLQKGFISDPLKMRIWNIFYDEIVSKVEWPLRDIKTYKFLEDCWDSIFKLNVFTFRKIEDFNLTRIISDTYKNNLKWYEVFDLIEETLQEFNQTSLKEKFNIILKQEGSAYRIINNQVVEITSGEEIKEIERVFEQPEKFNPVKQHLDKALRYLSNREKPDYENSIKESISALESLVKISLGKKGTLGELIKKVEIHHALKDGISKLYGWSGDESGVRHGSDGKSNKIDEEEARLILILSSALINYIISKCGDKNDTKN